MSYSYTPYKESAYTLQKKKQQDNATNKYNQWANQQYHAGSGGYKNEINTAKNRLNNLYNNNNLSQTFKYKNQKQYDKALNNLVNRKAFEYDLSDDVLFQQYKDNYEAMGKTAMSDTIGQASAMTGGYGNSYATAAGAQAYNNYLQEINSSLGDFYNMALAGYNAESDRLNNVYSAMSADRSAAQNEWKGNWDVYNSLYSMYSNDYNNMLDRDRDQYNQHGQNLYNAANLYSNQYGTASGNDINVWNSGEGLKAQQAQQEETARANRINESLSRSKATYNGGTKDGKKKENITPGGSKRTAAIIQRIGSGPTPSLSYIRNIIQENVDAGVITKGEAAYLYDYYHLA